jgi:REP-associated tyrosine transposase
LLFDDVSVLVERELVALTARFDGVSLDCWKIMPDHLHALVVLCGCRSTVSMIVQAFKSITTREVKQTLPIDRLWQRGFHDRIVRNEMDMDRRREYIRYNEVVHAGRNNQRPKSNDP